MQIHPFPGIAAFLRGMLIATGATLSAFVFLPGDYVFPAAAAASFVGALALGGE